MNIALIGMPTCGKSTVGVVVAKMLGMDFTDTDILIQNKHNKRLSELIDEFGTDGFVDIEGEVISSLDLDNTVIATGGSAVYSKNAIKRLKEISTIVYLKVPLSEVTKRMTNIRTRGVVIKEGESLEDIYNERTILYEKYTDIVLDESGKTLEQTVKELVLKFQK